MMMMKIGIRAEEGIDFLNKEMKISENSRTKVIAKPMPMPLETFEVTASAEHSPIISIRSGFS